MANDIPQDSSSASPDYILGHTETELARLVLQARFYERQTESLFAAAGIVAGQRVLDFGCGTGDVSLLAARFVGSTGSVVGVDRSLPALQTARARCAKLGIENVEFIHADDATLPLTSGSFDAIVGRLVLMYQSDPSLCLRRLAKLLRPEGAAVFQEVQMTTGWHGAVPASPLLDRMWALMSATCGRAGIELDMGLKLRQTLLKAGFVSPELLLTGRVEGGPDSPVYEYFAETIRSVLPAMVQLGIATAAEVDVDTLAARLREELIRSQGSVVVSMLVGGYARWPAAPSSVR